MSLQARTVPHHPQECEAGSRFELRLEKQIMYNTRVVAGKAGERPIAVLGSDYDTGGYRGTVSERLNLTGERFMRPAVRLQARIETS